MKLSAGINIFFKVFFSLFFIGGGINHFVMTDFYMEIMPLYLPWHLGLVYLSGVFEIVLGVGLLIPKTQARAAWGLVALLIAVFPANIQMYLDSTPTAEMANLVRLPVQLIFLYWAYSYTKRR